MPQVCKAENIYYVAHYRKCLLIPVIYNGLWEKLIFSQSFSFPKCFLSDQMLLVVWTTYFYDLEFVPLALLRVQSCSVTSPLNMTPSTAHISLPLPSGFGISSFAKRKRLGPLILDNSFQSRVVQATSVKGVPRSLAPHALLISSSSSSFAPALRLVNFKVWLFIHLY